MNKNGLISVQLAAILGIFSAIIVLIIIFVVFPKIGSEIVIMGSTNKLSRKVNDMCEDVFTFSEAKMKLKIPRGYVITENGGDKCPKEECLCWRRATPPTAGGSSILGCFPVECSVDGVDIKGIPLGWQAATPKKIAELKKINGYYINVSLEKKGEIIYIKEVENERKEY